MARFDIMPYRGGSQGTVIPPVEHYRLNASETFVEGEPVSVNADGELTESADDPAAEDFIGIAAMSGDTVGATNAIGIYRKRRGMFSPGISPNLPQTGDQIQVWEAYQGHTFRTNNFATDGSGTLTAPAAANIGDRAGLSLTAGQWSLDTGTTNFIARVVDVLDANGISLQEQGGTGVTVLFKFVTDELRSTSAPLA
jgi:hypothetical protein